MAATFQNLGFETAGVLQGIAAKWRFSHTATAEKFAAYGPPPGQGLDDFEAGWSNDDFATTFDPAPADFAFYDPGAGLEEKEDFEEQWMANEFWASTLGSIEQAQYDSGTPEDPEDFEEEWSNVPFLTTFVGVGTDLEQAQYDTAPEGAEDFAEGWSQNEWSQNQFAEPLLGANLTIFATGDLIQRDDAVSWFTVGFAHMEDGTHSVEVINTASNDGVHPITSIKDSVPEQLISSDALVNDATTNGEIWDHERAAYAATGRFETFEGTWPTVMVTL
jgi:hypothetical protein